MKNYGIWLTLFLCCGWPLIAHAGILYFTNMIKGRDWRNIQWSEFRWPWSKHD